MSLMLEDKGIVIYDEDTNKYYCGLNTFDKSLRKAQVFHKQQFVDYVFEKYSDMNLKTKNIEMKIV